MNLRSPKNPLSNLRLGWGAFVVLIGAVLVIAFFNFGVPKTLVGSLGIIGTLLVIANTITLANKKRTAGHKDARIWRGVGVGVLITALAVFSAMMFQFDRRPSVIFFGVWLITEVTLGIYTHARSYMD